MTKDQSVNQGLRLGSLIDGKYKVIAKIGKGGMSTVWLALNEKANKQWAIKEIRQTEKNGSEIVKQNLLTEIGILKKLEHENLPQIIDIFEKNDTYLIIMDYVQGRTLKSIMDERGPQPQDDVVDWAIQLCSVLDYLHTRPTPIIYRDLKPGNVMLRPDGKVILIDFGTAREYKDDQEEDTISLGTRGYAAPEQYGGEGQTDARTDIYNLGATISYLLTGRNPNKAPYEIRPIREWDPSLSTGLESIVLKCVANNPADRYQTAKELRFALEHYRELETSYIQEKKSKLKLFSVLASMSAISLLSSFVLSTYADSMKTTGYEEQIHIAASLPERERQIDAYKEAIQIDPSREEAYRSLLNNVFLVDGNFSQDEVDKMVSILGYKDKGGGETLESKLRKSPEAYDKFAYDMGIAYFYYYGEDGNKQLSQPWFDVAKQSKHLSKVQVERSKRFSQIAEYNMRINLKNKAGDTSVAYDDYWDNMVMLASGNVAKEDNVKTALVVYKELTGQILVHANNFKNAGVSKKVIESELEVVELRLSDLSKMDEFDPDVDQDVLDEILQNIEDARRTLDIVYSD